MIWIPSRRPRFSQASSLSAATHRAIYGTNSRMPNADASPMLKPVRCEAST